MFWYTTGTVFRPSHIFHMTLDGSRVWYVWFSPLCLMCNSISEYVPSSNVNCNNSFTLAGTMTVPILPNPGNWHFLQVHSSCISRSLQVFFNSLSYEVVSYEAVVSKIRQDLKEICVASCSHSSGIQSIKRRTRFVIIIFKQHRGQPEGLK